MNLPKVIASLVEAQNSHDSQAYAACFSDSAIVHDEGKAYSGKAEIQQWNEASNSKYQTIFKPLNYEDKELGSSLIAEVSGNFPGSPATLHFELKLKDGLINSLKITG
jgi:ketosteroid isomerase-like protein